MSYKEHCTKGPVTVKDYGHENAIHVESEPGAAIAQTGGRTTDIKIAEANASLIAEAFNVLHETGCTPAELAAFVKQVARLETAAEFDERTDDEGMSGDDAVDAISQLIEQARDLLT